MPGFDAKTPEEIADHLMMEKDKDILAEMGHKSRTYAEAYLSPESMARQVLDKIFPGSM